MGRRLITGVVAFAMILWSLPLGSTPAAAVSPDIVISQIYGGGGNSGAFYRNDYIELYNRGTTTVSVTGWSVQYASSAGTSWTNKTNLTGAIAPGRYYLVQEAAGAGGSANLPTADATGTITMAAGAGKVALVNNQTPLTGTGCSAPGVVASTSVVDLVGYGTGASGANCFEGSAAPTLSNTTAALRQSGGATDTDQNGADFATAFAGPRNSGNTDTAPYIVSVSFSPAAAATAVARSANIVLNTSEPVNVTGAWYSIVCVTSGSHTGVVTVTSTQLTIDPTSDFVFSESCTVTITASLVTDVDANDPPDPLVPGPSWSFTVAGPPVPGAVRIHDIQGAAHISPLKGLSVTNVPGIVTALRDNGFYLQDPVADTDSSTSEGIFVFTVAAPSVSVGDSIVVSASVSEFRPGGSGSGNLTVTELSGPTVVVIAGGNPLPAPVVIGIDRTPPTEVIEDDAASGDVETSGIFDPTSDGIDFWESLEGMRVEIPNPVATGPSNTFNEISVLANDGAGATGRTAHGGIVISATDKNPEKVVLDDEVLKVMGLPFPTQINVGDHFAGSVVGVIDYNFGLFMLELTTSPTKLAGGLAREVTTPPGAHELTVATFNVENLDPFDGATKFATLAQLIVHNLLSPDVISLEEVQDNDGPAGNGTTAADVTLGMLRDAIVAAGGPRYESREIDPVANQDGGEPTGNIRQVIFFNQLSGVSFVDRPNATSTTANSVVNVGGSPQLLFSPGRIDPNNAAFNNSRKPLAAEFTYNGHHLFVIANHWNSKGGDDPLWGHRQPPVLSSEVQRLQQATIVKGFVQDILAIDASAKVVVLGDLNDFEWSNPVMTLKTTPLNDLIETLPANERYTYVFEGNSQTLDHILVSNSLLPLAKTDVVHVNSEFWDQASDHEPQVARLLLADTTPPTITGTATPAPNANGWNNTAVLVQFTCADNVGIASCTGPTTLGEGAGQSVTGTATDLSGNTATATVTASIDLTAPTFAWIGNAGTYTIDQTVVIACTTTETLSGVDPALAHSCDSVDATAASLGVGSHTLTASATDRAGNTSSASTSFMITVDATSLCALTRSLATNDGIGTSLCAKLDAAAASLARGNLKTHDNQLQAYINEVNAQRGKAITDANATLLIALAGTL